MAIETGQVMSALQTSTTTPHYFLKMISPGPSFYVTAGVVSMVPTLVGVDAFALPSCPPSRNAPPPPTVCHRVSVLFIRTIQHLVFEYE
jgi:hypothetical protein